MQIRIHFFYFRGKLILHEKALINHIHSYIIFL